MQEKLDALMAEVEALKEQVADLETRLGWLEDNCISVDSGWDAVSFVQSAIEFADLDNIQEYSEENIIILHTNCFRTAALANAYKAPARWNMHELSDSQLTVELLKQNINRSKQGEYILMKSNVFSISDEFEKVIFDAIAERKVFFILCTSDLNTIPTSIREKMRVIQ